MRERSVILRGIFPLLCLLATESFGQGTPTPLGELVRFSGTGHAITILDADVNGVPLVDGTDSIGVFDLNGVGGDGTQGVEALVGFEFWQGTPDLAFSAGISIIPVPGQPPTPGANSGNPMVFKIHHGSTGQTVDIPMTIKNEQGMDIPNPDISFGSLVFDSSGFGILVINRISGRVSCEDDKDAPVLSCSEDLTLSTDESVCSSSEVITPPVSFDLCDPHPLVTSLRSDQMSLESPFELGTTTITWTAMDASDNVSEQCIQEIVVEDNVNPTAVCRDLTVELEFGQTQLFVSPEQIGGDSKDACGPLSLSLNQTEFSNTDIGANVVTLMVADDAGNTDSCMATVAIERPAGDLDQDGLKDTDEAPNLTDLMNWDSDGDSIDDGYEVAKGLDPAVDDAGGDLDADGLSNLEEYRGADNQPPLIAAPIDPQEPDWTNGNDFPFTRYPLHRFY